VLHVRAQTGKRLPDRSLADPKGFPGCGCDLPNHW